MVGLEFYHACAIYIVVMDEKNPSQNTPLSVRSNKNALTGVLFLVLLAVVGLWAYNSWQEGTLPLSDGNISRGGKYEALAKDHLQGEKFLEYINSAFGRLENEDPDDNASAYLDIGFYKNELGDKEGAIQAYRAGIEQYPRHEVMVSNLAHIYEDMKEYESAEKYYQKLLEVNPRNVRGIIDFASLYRYYFDDKQDAIVDMVEVRGLANNPNEFNLLIFLANYYRYDMQDLRKAEIYYRQILELDPQNISVQVELRNLLEQQGRTL